MFCKCGCGEEAKEGNYYVWHHHRNGKKSWNNSLTKETDERIAAAGRKVSIKLEGNKNAQGYKHTEEAKKNIGLGHIGNKNMFGHRHSKETKDRIRIGNTGKIVSEETKNKISIAKRGIKQSEETCKKKSLLMKGKKNALGYKWSEETRRKRIGRSCSHSLGRGKQGYREDLGDVWFRSTWEANVARILNILGVPYEYESKRFDLGDTTYCPDFLCFPRTEHEYFIEVKGYKDQKWIKKESKFREFHPNIKLSIVGEKEYKELKKEFLYLISNWEY